MSSEVYFFVLYAELFPDIAPVKIDCAFGQIQDFRDFFCGFTMLNKIRYLNFRGSEGDGKK